MKTDSEIQKSVIEELKWEPLLSSNEIGVSVKNGVVTLSGTLDSYLKKIAAEKATRKVTGVKAVAEDIIVKLEGSSVLTDSEIAQAVMNTLKWHSGIQEDKIKVKVENGIVSLDGEVEWEFQRKSAREMIENIKGVRGIANNIALTPRLLSKDLKQKISAAFHRHATVDSNKINIEIKGSKVIISGKVRSWAEKRDAEFAVWNSPGVKDVVNKLEIEREIFAL